MNTHEKPEGVVRATFEYWDGRTVVVTLTEGIIADVPALGHYLNLKLSREGEAHVLNTPPQPSTHENSPGLLPVVDVGSSRLRYPEIRHRKNPGWTNGPEWTFDATKTLDLVPATFDLTDRAACEGYVCEQLNITRERLTNLLDAPYPFGKVYIYPEKNLVGFAVTYPEFLEASVQ